MCTNVLHAYFKIQLYVIMTDYFVSLNWSSLIYIVVTWNRYYYEMFVLKSRLVKTSVNPGFWLVCSKDTSQYEAKLEHLY